MFTPSPLARLARCAGVALATALSAVALSSCSSSGTASNSGGQIAGTVTYMNPARGSMLGLVSQSMLAELGVPGETIGERVLNFSSEPKASASVKVCQDDILGAVIELLDDEGFAKYSVEGAADREDRSQDGFIEVVVNGSARHMVNSDDSQTDPKAKVAFTNLLTMFAQVYGEVRQYQAVDGQVEFKEAEVSDRLKNQSARSDTNLFQGSIR